MFEFRQQLVKNKSSNKQNYKWPELSKNFIINTRYNSSSCFKPIPYPMEKGYLPINYIFASLNAFIYTIFQAIYRIIINNEAHYIAILHINIKYR